MRFIPSKTDQARLKQKFPTNNTETSDVRLLQERQECVRLKKSAQFYYLIPDYYIDIHVFLTQVG